MLHTINQSPFRSPVLDTCLRFVQPDDVILLIEDGVYSAQDSNIHSEKVKKALAKNEICALVADLKARGIIKILEGIKTIDYDGFVQLVEEHQVNTWL